MVFAGSFYAHFDQTSVPYSAPHTWFVSLVLHLETVLLVVSLIFFLVGAFGLLGSIRENETLLDIYGSLLSVLVIVVTFFALFVLFLPLIGRGFVNDQITPDFILHYRDKADYKQVSGCSSLSLTPVPHCASFFSMKREL